MDLNRIGVFAAVVKGGSLTKAAREIGLTTSAVSRTLVRLEEELGVRLLQRTTRKLSLTAAGRAYFDRCVEHSNLSTKQAWRSARPAMSRAGACASPRHPR